MGLSSTAPTHPDESPLVLDSTKSDWLLLFPLHAVLFPQGVLPLKIFETRYLDMVSNCMKTKTDFGVVLIKSGQEVGAAASPEMVGCSAHIVHWDASQDLLLTIRVEGVRRFRIVATRVTGQPMGQQLEARVLYLDERSSESLPIKYVACASALQLITEDMAQQASAAWFARPYQFADMGWVANRWSEILPIPLAARQKLLELDDAESRLAIIDQYLHQHQII